MKKIVAIVIMGILVFSGLGAATNSIMQTNPEETTIQTEKYDLNVAQPAFIQEDDGFVTISMDESDGVLSKSGSPMIPVITQTFDFPVGTIINNVQVNINWERYDLDRKVTPTPVSLPLSVDVDASVVEEMSFNEEVYASAALYPSEPYSVRYGAGLKDLEHVVFVNVKCYPQYSPANNYINIPETIDIDIEYEAAENPEPTAAEQYDLIIVTPDLFVNELQPLVTHKENMGISTKMVTVEEIYEDYDGATDFEEIKMYLADHVLDWDTKFVLLAGGHKGQTYDWYVPDMESHNWDPNDEYGTWDETYSSDLYYADLYRTNQYGQIIFDSWDTNNNGIYAEGPLMDSGTDAPDYYPDVCVGRLPFRYTWEVPVGVNKIIDYELHCDESWFKTALLAGGDGFPTERYPGQAKRGIWEGEIACDAAAELLANRGIVSTKAYCSDDGDIKVRGPDDLYGAVNQNGYGFAFYTGHACPFSLGSYEPDTYITEPEAPFTPFYTGFDLIHYDNDGTLPFFICEGCHNAEFDVTMQELIDYALDAYYLHPDYGFIFGNYEWIPHDASSWLVLQEGGGAIGLIGNTALGSGGINEHCLDIVGEWLMMKFFEGYGVAGEDYTGAMWTYGINGYINTFDVMSDSTDRKTIEERVLLGDPSLKLGGYGSSFSEDNEPESEETIYGPVAINAPTWSVGDSWTYRLDNFDFELNSTEGRTLTFKLSAGDITLEVVGETSNSYQTTLTCDDIDLTIGTYFDFLVNGVNPINIPPITLNNVQLDSKLTIDKENLGIKAVNLGIVFDLIENLDNIEAMLQMQFPAFIDKLASFMQIPANIELDIAFDQPFEILQFPLENDEYWGAPANTATITIDGSIESVWLRVLSFINKFIPIIPAEFAQYLPNIDISDILEDMGIESNFQFNVPEIPAKLADYHSYTTPTLSVKGSESVTVPAGQYNAVHLSFADDNGILYYSEAENSIIKIQGFISAYIPIINDINLELVD